LYPELVTTSADGHFDFPKIHRWRGIGLVPAPDANHEWIRPMLVIEASGYMTIKTNIMVYESDRTGEVFYLTPNPAR
jgi:hypothetical protein